VDDFSRATPELIMENRRVEFYGRKLKRLFPCSAIVQCDDAGISTMERRMGARRSEFDFHRWMRFC
jgi:hypothetical protein